MKDKIIELTNRLKLAADAYYNDSESLMSDQEYDMAIKELEELESKFPEFALEDSPTKTVGSKTKSTFAKVKHEYPMLSLDNTYNKEDIDAFVRRVKKVFPKAVFTCEPKYDGVSIDLKYEDSKLVQAITRGNGVIGEDVTENVKMISDVPHTLNTDKKLNIRVRGEILMSKVQFSLLNKERANNNQQLYMNPRNTASGTIRQHDTDVVRDRKLESRMYYLYGMDNLEYQESILDFLKTLGFNAGKYYNRLTTSDDIVKVIEEFDKERDKLAIETDGMVIKVSQVNKWEEIGYTGRAPRYAIAFKYNTEKATTKLNNVVWQVGRTGKITPVAEFDGVYLAGTNVLRATLHNMDQIRAKGIKIGDSILVEKAAEIIPQVIGPIISIRTGDEKFISEPKTCPICNSKLVKFDNKVDLFCVNWHCKSRLALRLEHFISRDAINVMHMGPALIKSLMEEGVLNKLTDIYKLVEKYKDSPFPLEYKVSVGISKSKTNDPIGLLYGIGIPGVGISNAKKLMNKFCSLTNLIEADEKEIKDLIGNVVGENICEWRRNPDTALMIDELKKFGVNLTMKDCGNANGKFTGKNFVLTGTMNVYLNKREIIKIIEKLGGDVQSSVTKNTDYVIVGEDAGSKLKKAKELNIKCLTELEFEELIK